MRKRSGKSADWLVRGRNFDPTPIEVAAGRPLSGAGFRSLASYVVAGAGEANPDNTLILGSDGLEIAVWTYPNDPHLPGLAIAEPELQLVIRGARVDDVIIADARCEARPDGRRARTDTHGRLRPVP